LLVAPARIDRSATIARALSMLDWSAFESAYAALEADASRIVAETIPSATRPSVQRLADMRFVGQGYEVVTQLPDGPYRASSAPVIRAAFEQAYETLFGRRPPVAEIEIINIRVSLTAAAGSGALDLDLVDAGATPIARSKRFVRFAAGAALIDTPVYERAALGIGSHIAGPAVIEEASSTLLVPPGASAEVDAAGNIVIDLA
jgi:N-methylhydantoinase A